MFIDTILHSKFSLLLRPEIVIIANQEPESDIAFILGHFVLVVCLAVCWKSAKSE